MAANLPILGVGLTYSSGLDPLLESHPELVDVIEVEPQTLWYQSNQSTTQYRPDDSALARVKSFPCAKILHGIGFPVGGSRPPDTRQAPLLRTMICDLDVPWMSEHLSFNQAHGIKGRFNTGFMLPPCQTPEGVSAAVTSIRSMAEQISVPLLVETGVNYLKHRDDEMLDGDFVRAVVEAADCWILLDLHNLWANERNGRQPVLEFLEQIPLDRVREVHLAGGQEYKGYWIDGHSGAIPEPLVELAFDVVPRLPNLGALVFEIFPAYIPVVGLDLVVSQLEKLREIWNARGNQRLVKWQHAPFGAVPVLSTTSDGSPTPEEWEDVLGALVVSRQLEGKLAEELAADPGIGIIQDLLGEFRSSMIVRVLPLTTRLLMLTLGPESFRAILAEYWQNSTPGIFASEEGRGFATFLEDKSLDLLYLPEILAYDRAVVAALIEGQSRTIRFDYDPFALLEYLGNGQVPATLPSASFELKVTPDQGGSPDDATDYRLRGSHH